MNEDVALSLPRSSFRVEILACCGLAGGKARPWAKRLSWQTQGERVK
jgi:hypothetical protein